MRAGYGIWLYQFLIIAYLFTLRSQLDWDEKGVLYDKDVFVMSRYSTYSGVAYVLP